MFLVLITCVVILGVVFGIDRLLKNKDFEKIPGPAGFPLIGNALDFIQDQEKTFNVLRNLTKKYKDLFKVRVGHIRVCFVYNPEDIETLISGTKCNSKSSLYRFLKPWLQEGLLLSDGQKWQQRRKMLTPAFHFNILRHYNSILAEKSRQLVENIAAEGDKTKIDILPLISQFTLNSICETAMGQKLDQERSNHSKDYIAAIHELGVYLLYRMQRVFLHLDFVFNLTTVARTQRKLLDTMSSFRDRVINQRSKEFKEMLAQQDHYDEETSVTIDKKKLAMLDLLLDAKERGIIDTKGISEEIETFMFEGHDTTASALQFIFLMLANNEEIQEKIIKEYCDVMGSLAHDATMRDLSELKYLECCIKESMRLYPPVPFFSRRCHQEIKLKDYTLPANTDVTILLYDLHRRADIFSEPTVYKPERFMTERPSWHQFAYVPFSAGPRNCVGQKFAMMEMKLAVSTVLRSFRILPVTKPEDVVFLCDIILRPKDKIYVNFVKRF